MSLPRTRANVATISLIGSAAPITGYAVPAVSFGLVSRPAAMRDTSSAATSRSMVFSLPHRRRRRVGRRLIHHEVDEARNAFLARRNGRGRSGIRQSILNRIGKIDRRNIFDGLLHGSDVKEITNEDFGAERVQMVGTFVDLADQGANGNAARQRHFRDVSAGLALIAAGRGGHEHWFRHHNDPLHIASISVPLGTGEFDIWYHPVPRQGEK